MKGIHYLTDDQNRKVAVQIDLKKHGELWEDFYDALVAEERKNEPAINLENLIEELKKENKLPQ